MTGYDLDAGDTAVRIGIFGLFYANWFNATPSNFNNVLVGETGKLITTQGLSVARDAIVTIEGGVEATSNAITTMGNCSVLVTGTVRGNETGVNMQGGLSGQYDVVQNGGVISGRYDAGVTAFHALTVIRNTGTIAQTGTNDPFFWSCGIKVVNGAQIENSGLITGIHSGIRLSDVASLFTLINSGTVSGGFAGLDGTLMTSSGTIFSIINTGTISGGNFTYAGGGEYTSLTNSCTMIGAVDLGSGADYLDTSRGTILGNVFLGDGDDMLKTYGATLDSDVYGGLGSDTYFVDSEIGIVEEVSLGDIDTVNARCSFELSLNIENLQLLGAGNFLGRGNEDANDITGNSGQNSLYGMAGNDTMTGRLGDDLVSGGAGNDSVSGHDGEDVVQGGIGSDTLSGGDGDDLLIGGAGKDTLTGGAGADRFVFSILSHSAATQTSADIITDFLAGEDLIDLSALDAIRPNAKANDAFAFIGLGAFSGVAGQLRYLQSGGRTFLEMDVDGDSVADATIRLNGLITLNAGDLIL